MLWEFGAVIRNAMGRLPVRRDVDVTGFPRPTAPAPARQEISLPRRDAAHRSTKTKKEALSSPRTRVH